MTPKFLQLHTLVGYAATLLNRDDMGKAKRLPFGGSTRTRVSSQCLKRHWREAAGEWSLGDLGTGRSVRSRRVFSQVIADRLETQGKSIGQILDVLVPIRSAVLGESVKARKARKAAEESAEDRERALASLETSQVIVLGKPEIEFLEKRAAELSRDDSAATAKAVNAYFKDKAHRKNFRALTQGAGLDAALFGRMVTSDLMARLDAAVHVSHAFTVHAEEAEADYFSALDDLRSEAGELGAGHINLSELTSGLFYSYVVVDLRQLTMNLSGDATVAKAVLERLPRLIATVSPGAKRGSTAPYACAEFVLAEVGSRQPRTLANAFMKPVRTDPGVKQDAVRALGDYLAAYDAMYGPHEERRVATMIEPVPSVAGTRGSLAELADWAATHVSA